MQLSIAMIVKNEEKNLDRTLKALSGLENKLSYEIIIVDTGSTDNTIKIAGKYTDKIYEHAWSGNFSEMRNISLGYCTGEWILVLDADEVIINTDEIVNFLESEEGELFNSATIEINNCENDTEKISTSARLRRLFRNTGNLKYTGKVHEQPPTKFPMAQSKIGVMHYGYDSNDYELMNYKFERNTKLLKEELATAKDEYKIYVLFQLSKSYSMANKVDEALKYIKLSYDLEKKRNKKSVHTYVYHWYASVLFNRKEYEKTISVCKEAIKYLDNNLDIFCMLAISCSVLGKYKEAYKYYNKYFDIRKKRENGEYNEDLTLSEGTFDWNVKMLSNKIVCYFKEEKYEEVIKEFENNKEVSEKKNIESAYIRSCIFTNNLHKVSKFYENIEINDEDVERLSMDLIDMDINDSVDNINEIRSVFSSIDEKLKIYIDAIYNDVLLDEISIDFTKYYKWKERILEKYLLKDASNFNLIKSCSNEVLRCYIFEMNKRYEFVDIMYDYTKERFLVADIKELNFISIMQNIIVFDKSIIREKHKELVLRCLITNKILRGKIYNTGLLEDDYLRCILDEDDRFWFDIEREVKSYSNGRLEYIRELNHMLKINDKYADILKVFLTEISEEAINTDMVEEKEKLYVVIEQFISQNKLSDAEELVNELQKLFKWDGKLLSYRGIINYIKGELNESLLDLSLANVLMGDNFDFIFNIACVLEKQGRIKDCKEYYEYAYNICAEEEMKMQIKGILNAENMNNL